LISPASHLRNPALQDSYRIFNQDCELVSQLPILYDYQKVHFLIIMSQGIPSTLARDYG
jgi:hypothetical protein